MPEFGIAGWVQERDLGENRPTQASFCAARTCSTCPTKAAASSSAPLLASKPRRAAFRLTTVRAYESAILSCCRPARWAAKAVPAVVATATQAERLEPCHAP